jgi:osmotically-inducible protein OsmY
MNDLQLQDDVRAALVNDPHVTAKDVAISCRAGTVTLRGTVPNFKQRHAALAAARSVPGVEDVYDLLKVRVMPGDPRDDEIRAAVLQSLIGDARIQADQIDADVAAAWVTLKGEVKHQSESDAALEDVRRVESVGGITNEIRVVTAP